jgi:eukaryotic-like serine/threonine-protein kinase
MNPGSVLLGRYRIEKSLAVSGFGETYLAIDLHLPGQRQVVLKHLKPPNDDPATLRIAQRMFESEAQVLEELGENSDRIPRLYAYFEDKVEKRINRMVEIQREFYLVQEFIEGQTLATELKLAAGKLSEAQVIEILQEILVGLQEVHQKGKIHRDLKPDNIIRQTENGNLVLIDFGAVKEMRRVTSLGVNMPLSDTISIGTQGYIPGEQWRGSPRPASDVYAVGAIGIQALTGKDPSDLFDEEVGAFCWQQLCQVSPELTLILEKMVAQQLGERYQNAMEVAKAIEQLLNLPQLAKIPTQHPVSSSPLPVVPSPPATTPPVVPNIPVQPPVATAPITPPAKQSASLSPISAQSPVSSSPTLPSPRPVMPPSQPEAQSSPLAQKALAPETLLQSSSPQASIANTTNQHRARRGFLKWLLLGGTGLVGSLAFGQLFKNSSASVKGSVPQLTKIQFTSAKLNSYGEIVDQPAGQAEMFTEDLGNGASLKMVKIAAGKFIMGSPANEEKRSEDEGPQHQVAVPEFYLGQTLVTQGQWQALMGSNPSGFKGDSNLPVDSVSWLDAMDFCQKLSRKTGHTYRLPSEAEWEYACRAGATTPFTFGATITSAVVNYGGNYTDAKAAKGEHRKKTMVVGSFPANLFGLYDMHGNLWEWCLDEWSDSYQNAPDEGSAKGNITSRDGSKKRVLRGGSWFNLPEYCRSAIRNRGNSNARGSSMGFRVVYVPARIL